MPRKNEKNRTGKPLNAWIDTQLMEAFDGYCAKNRRTKTAEIEMAIEERLRADGMWPPKVINSGCSLDR